MSTDPEDFFETAASANMLEIKSGGSTAWITMAEGTGLDCRIDKLEAAPAIKCILRVLGFNKGSFLVRPYRHPESVRLGIAVPELLVDGLFKLDEMTVLRQRLPDGNGVALSLARPLLAPLSALDEADLDILQLAHNTGTVNAVLDGSSETDLEAAQRLLSLLDGGYLRKA